MYFDSELLLLIIDENLRNEDLINGLKFCIFYIIWIIEKLVVLFYEYILIICYFEYYVVCFCVF